MSSTLTSNDRKRCSKTSRRRRHHHHLFLHAQGWSPPPPTQPPPPPPPQVIFDGARRGTRHLQATEPRRRGGWDCGGNHRASAIFDRRKPKRYAAARDDPTASPTPNKVQAQHINTCVPPPPVVQAVGKHFRGCRAKRFRRFRGCNEHSGALRVTLSLPPERLRSPRPLRAHPSCVDRHCHWACRTN